MEQIVIRCPHGVCRLAYIVSLEGETFTVMLPTSETLHVAYSLFLGFTGWKRP